MSSRSGAFGYSSSRYSEACSGRTSIKASTDASHSSTRCCGSHIIRSRLTLSNPAASCGGHGAAGRVRGVKTSEPLQFLVAKRLDTEADTIDAGVSI